MCTKSNSHLGMSRAREYLSALPKEIAIVTAFRGATVAFVTIRE